MNTVQREKARLIPGGQKREKLHQKKKKNWWKLLLWVFRSVYYKVYSPVTNKRDVGRTVFRLAKQRLANVKL